MGVGLSLLERIRAHDEHIVVVIMTAFGNMDTAIAIRTVLVHGEKAYVQAGAGIVADSDPQREYEETMNKAGALLNAINQAERAGSGGGK